MSDDLLSDALDTLAEVAEQLKLAIKNSPRSPARRALEHAAQVLEENGRGTEFLGSHTARRP